MLQCVHFSSLNCGRQPHCSLSPLLLDPILSKTLHRQPYGEVAQAISVVLEAHVSLWCDTIESNTIKSHTIKSTLKEVVDVLRIERMIKNRSSS